ncbi:ABC-type multidrug transport system, ATPase and permease component [Sanguibacter keddieii DSM 10542]|uniref:ABC-type multidrug transport system, ATPase and permease component n=1 Tax=Sanguibacter keddieii (strain ATCC 51767 / DSM 10542 / NCFB 3025 / ST-74) TaxID=446469 RepID=D1BGA2_SANKS|nr:ABC-type multidrug transport system, ATPase and permease component [Sanguibacter keddieii DSM 10542]
MDPSRPQRSPVPDASGWSAARLVRYSLLGARRGRLLGVGSVGLMLHQVSEALVPVVVGAVVDQAIVPRDGGALVRWLGLLVVVFTVLTLAWRTGMLATMRVYAYGQHDLRDLVVHRTLDPRGAVAPRAPGEVLSIATSDTSRVAGTAWMVAECLGAVAAVVTVAVSLLLVSVPLGLAVLVATPLVLVVMHRLSVPLESRSAREQEAAARAGTLATDSMTGLRVLKGLGAEDAAVARYRAASRGSLTAALRAARAKAAYTSLSAALSSVFLAGIALAAGWMALRGSITTGELVMVVGLAQLVQNPMSALGFLGVDLAQRRASAQRLRALLADPHLLLDGGDGTPASPDGAPGPAEVLISVRGTRTVARAAVPSTEGTADDNAVDSGDTVDSAEVPLRPGDVVGVVAHDHASAQHLVDALGLRAVPVAGLASVRGTDLADADPSTVRTTVFAAEHDAAVLAGTVRDVVRSTGSDAAATGTGAAGTGSASGATSLDERVVATSGLAEVLTHLPTGLDSPVSPRGHNLSGGQRQRLVLARALHRPEPVLVLHDPTTAVDSVTEAAIAAGLRDFPDKAVLVVTTSPALLAACDTVVHLGPVAPPDAADDAAPRPDRSTDLEVVA